VINLDNISKASLDYIKKYFDQFLPMTPDEIKGLMSYCDLRQFDKNTVFLQEGETDDYLNMIVTGIVIKYARSRNKKLILQLSTEGHVINSEISFLTRTPSKVYLETLEPTTLVSLRYDKMEEALAFFPKGERLGRLIQEGMYVKKDERRYAMLSKSMRERFLDYVKQHPHMLQRVSQKYLASYLNITSETFSRFKHLLRSENVKQ
jgi:CRP-like cAMP-binding protein